MSEDERDGHYHSLPVREESVARGTGHLDVGPLVVVVEVSGGPLLAGYLEHDHHPRAVGNR